MENSSDGGNLGIRIVPADFQRIIALAYKVGRGDRMLVGPNLGLYGEFSQDQVTPLTSIDAIQEKKTSKVVPAVPAIKKRTCCGPTVSYVAPATTCHRSS